MSASLQRPASASVVGLGAPARPARPPKRRTTPTTVSQRTPTRSIQSAVRYRSSDAESNLENYVLLPASMPEWAHSSDLSFDPLKAATQGARTPSSSSFRRPPSHDAFGAALIRDERGFELTAPWRHLVEPPQSPPRSPGKGRGGKLDASYFFGR